MDSTADFLPVRDFFRRFRNNWLIGYPAIKKKEKSADVLFTGREAVHLFMEELGRMLGNQHFWDRGCCFEMLVFLFLNENPNPMLGGLSEKLTEHDRITW